MEDLPYHSWKSSARNTLYQVTYLMPLLTTSILSSILLTSSPFIPSIPCTNLAAFSDIFHLEISIWISKRPIFQVWQIPHFFHAVYPYKFARSFLLLLSCHAPCRDGINICLMKLKWIKILIAICFALVTCRLISSLWTSGGLDSTCFKFTSLQLLSLHAHN